MLLYLSLVYCCRLVGIAVTQAVAIEQLDTLVGSKGTTLNFGDISALFEIMKSAQMVRKAQIMTVIYLLVFFCDILHLLR